MSKLAHSEVRWQAVLPETRKPELRLAEGGRPQPSESLGHQVRRQPRLAKSVYRAVTGWRTRAW